MALDTLSRPPSLCETHTQMQTALRDLQDEFANVQALADFLEEETIKGNKHRWPEMKLLLLAQALDHRVEKFRQNLDAVAELAQEAAE